MVLKRKTHKRIAGVQRNSKQAEWSQPVHEQPSHPANVLQRTPTALRPADILALQRTIGNRVVQRMLHRTEEDRPIKGHSLSRRETGLPDGLKLGVESLSGISMDNVRVHYNSPEPAKLQARAYAQGTDIFLGPKEEEHLAHEAWHVVQQRQGRVRPTLQLKAEGVSVNDDAGLEREADVMGSQALRMTDSANVTVPSSKPVTHSTNNRTIQRVGDTMAEKTKLWSWLERQQLAGGVKSGIPLWRETNMAKFWPLVEAILEPLKTKAATAQTALNNIADYMLRPDPVPSLVEVDALVSSAPEVEGSPVIRTNTDANKLATLKAKLTWLARPSQWLNPLKAEIKRKKENLEFTHQWQIYGEAILSEQNKSRDPKIQAEMWKTTATNIVEEIKKDSIGTVNTWLDDIIARTKTLERLWEEGTRTITGAHGTLPQATIKQLFMRYDRLTSRDILTAAMNTTVSGLGDWGGVKYLTSHATYARELKISEMGGDQRVLSDLREPTILHRIGSIH